MKNKAGCGCLVGIVLIGFMAYCSATSRSDQGRAQRETTTTADTFCAPGFIAGTSTLSTAIRAVQQKDPAAIQGLIERKSLIAIPAQTKLKIISTIDGSSIARVQSGFNVDLQCWFLSTYLR